MKNQLLFTFFFLLSSFLSAQLITISEVDESGKRRTITGNRSAVDINSKLYIDIDKSKLTEEIDRRLISDGSNYIDSVIYRLQLYKELIDHLNYTITRYEMLFDSPGSKPLLDSLRAALQDRGRTARNIVALFPEGSRFALRREEALSDPGFGNKGSTEGFRVIMRLLADELQFSELEVGKLREEAGFYFQLAAWYAGNRGTESLHLDGFDDLPQGEFYHYERNKFYLTEKQMAELQGLHEFFENAENSNIFEKLAGVLPELVTGMINTEEITMQIAMIKSKLDGFVTAAIAEKQNIIDRTKEIETNFFQLRTDISSLREKYTTGSGFTSASSGTGLLRAFMTDVNAISNSVSNIAVNIKSLLTGVDFESLGTGVHDIRDQFTKLGRLLEKEAINLIDHARHGYQTAVFGRQINTAALELSEEILKLSIASIPASTILDLNFAGKRDPGDLIVVKALVWKGNNPSPVITEVKEFPLLNALPHVHMTVAYSFSKPNDDQPNWKGGPLVGILYKFKSRSLPYRNFVDAGIGLHAASYDFNNDDTPEFAGGAVFSIFKDYLQFGWGFNFNAAKTYWFAGLRIPIPTAPVSLMGTQ